jgi:hypothetical protein
VLENLRAGQAQKAAAIDSTDFMRAVLPLIVGNASFVLGTMDEQHGLHWIVPPTEPVEKAQEDKNRPPEAPTFAPGSNPSPSVVGAQLYPERPRDAAPQPGKPLRSKKTKMRCARRERTPAS